MMALLKINASICFPPHTLGSLTFFYEGIVSCLGSLVVDKKTDQERQKFELMKLTETLPDPKQVIQS